MDLGYYNGTWGPIDEIRVPINDRAMYFGDGVYDASVSHNGKILDFEAHMDRFIRSMDKLSIPSPMERGELEREIIEFSRKASPEKWGVIYWSATRATAPRNHAFPKGVPSNLLMTLTEVGGMRSSEIPMKLLSFEDLRFSYCDIKTLNLIPSCLAAQKAMEAGCDETVFVRDGLVTECAHSNISILKNGIFRTSQADNHILNGIARQNLIKAAKRAGIPVVEERFTFDELIDADEIIVSSSIAQLSPVCSVDGKDVGGRAPELLKLIENEINLHIDGCFAAD